MGHSQIEALKESIYEFCRAIAAKPSEKHNGYVLVLYGFNGCGKTMTAKAVHRWLEHTSRRLPLVIGPDPERIDARLAWSEFVHWPSLLDEFKSGNWEDVKNIIEAPLAVLDDLGAGHDPSFVGVDKLCTILSQREKRWTLITTNVHPEAWEEKFDRRVASRLLRHAKHVDLSNVPDFNAQ